VSVLERIELIYAVLVYQPGRCTCYIRNKEKEFLIGERVERERVEYLHFQGDRGNDKRTQHRCSIALCVSCD
jgi:hypothetical protein